MLGKLAFWRNGKVDGLNQHLPAFLTSWHTEEDSAHMAHQSKDDWSQGTMGAPKATPRAEGMGLGAHL